MTELKAIDFLYRHATHCRVCFGEKRALEAPIVDVAQPRWIGRDYWRTRPRIAVVLLNPGAGVPRKEDLNREARRLLVRYRKGEASLGDVFSFQRTHMQVWGNPDGRFLRFYIDGLDLKLDRVAFLNIALCATSGNRHPSKMLKVCFEKHTSSILQKLEPDIVLLSGKGTHAFSDKVQALRPSTRIITTLHFAHRKGALAEDLELARVRGLIRDHEQ